MPKNNKKSGHHKIGDRTYKLLLIGGQNLLHSVATILAVVFASEHKSCNECG